MKKLLIILLFAAMASAQGLDPQSVPRAGVHDLAAKNVSMLGWNPAGLGADRGKKMTLELPSFGFAAGNNSFSVGFYNDKFTGKDSIYLSRADKEEILDAIPDDGFTINMQAGIPALGFTYNRFGVRVGLESSTRATAPKDFARMVLYGNELDRRYSIDDALGEHQTVVDYGAGFAYKFDQEYLPEIYAGLSFHFYQGIFMARTQKTEGYIEFSRDHSLQGQGQVHSVTSNRGDGVGFDLGGMAKINDQWEVGLALRQIGAKLTWDVEETSFVSFYTDTTGIQPDSIGEDGYFDRYVHKVDTSYDGGGSVETELPVIIQANGLFKPSSKWTVLGDLAVRTKTSSQGKSGLEMGAAGQYNIFKWWIAQGGVSLGGPWGSRFGLGTGFHFGSYEIDLGGSYVGGLFAGQKGVAVAFSQRLKF